MKSQYEHIIHPFPPLYDNNSKILILGSLPSVKSREQMFFYGHPQNSNPKPASSNRFHRGLSGRSRTCWVSILSA